MKRVIFTSLILLLIIPLVLADIPPLPGEKSIPVNNRLVNIGNYTDYIFFATANPTGGPGFSMCPLEIIESDGMIRYNHYKLCNIAVYAIKKTDITESQLKSMNATQLETFIYSDTVVPLSLTGIYFSKIVPDSSSKTEENITHYIVSSKLKSNQNQNNQSDNNTNNEQNNQTNNPNQNNQSDITCPVGSTNEEGICKKTLSNGRVAEIKIMPETASENAIKKLGDLGFTVELKEVGKGNESKPVYELTGNKQGKFLGIFKITARVQAQVDAETGNVKVIKPWWSFLTSGI
jgi:hypothetical protein